MAVINTALYSQIENRISLNRMLAHVKSLNQWYRYTGTPQGEACVDDLLQRLRDAGIPYSVEEYEAHTSLPLSACVSLPDGRTIRAIADVYSGEAEELQADLVYDFRSAEKKRSANDEVLRFSAFRDKIVLSHDSGGAFAERLVRAGAKGMIHINTSPGGYIHHSNVSPFWGTPCRSEQVYLEELPAVGISQEDGKMLIELLSRGNLSVGLSIKMASAVKKSRMPVVDIPGKFDSFVLISGHYDSWYEGITDNATSDAILLELARAFWNCRDQLERGVRIAWWSGHSDARYAGSAWYCDQHWAELNKNCVASINLDLTGCKLSKQIRVRTTCMEGYDLTSTLTEEFTGLPAKPYIPMIRGGDQSFWGVRIPIHVMFKYEPTDEDRVSPCPSGGPWWHTDQDTLDKLDPEILLRDAQINAKLACRIVNGGNLPVDIPGYLSIMEGFLTEICQNLDSEFSLEAPLKSIACLRGVVEDLPELLVGRSLPEKDRAIKRIAGELVRLTYSYGSRYQQDRSTPYSPFGVFAGAKHMTRENTPETLFLYEKTEFYRACNRFCNEMEEIEQYIHHLSWTGAAICQN